MHCRGSALLACLLLATLCSVAVLAQPLGLIYSSVVFASSVHDAASPSILVEAFNTISSIHMSMNGRQRMAPYIATQVADDLLLHIQGRGDHHFSGGRAQLYQLPYHPIPHGQVWLSLVKTSPAWIQQAPAARSDLALVWQIIDGRFSLRGSFGLTKAYANTLRKHVPVWKPVRNREGGIQGFRPYTFAPRLGPDDPRP